MQPTLRLDIGQKLNSECHRKTSPVRAFTKARAPPRGNGALGSSLTKAKGKDDADKPQRGSPGFPDRGPAPAQVSSPASRAGRGLGACRLAPPVSVLFRSSESPVQDGNTSFCWNKKINIPSRCLLSMTTQVLVTKRNNFPFKTAAIRSGLVNSSRRGDPPKASGAACGPPPSASTPQSGRGRRRRQTMHNGARGEQKQVAVVTRRAGAPRPGSGSRTEAGSGGRQQEGIVPSENGPLFTRGGNQKRGGHRSDFP